MCCSAPFVVVVLEIQQKLSREQQNEGNLCALLNVATLSLSQREQ